VTIASLDNPICILLLDADAESCARTQRSLEQRGYSVRACSSDGEARDCVLRGDFDTVVADIDLDDEAGVALLEATQSIQPVVPLIIFTADTKVDGVLRAIHRGAFDYVLKEGPTDSLHSAIHRASERAHLQRRNARLVNELHRMKSELEDHVERRGRQLAQANIRLSSERGELERAVTSLRQAHSQLVQAEKAASLGLLTAGVAHEINNPLGFVLPNLSVLQQWVEALHEGQVPSTEVATDMLDVVRESREGLLRIRDIVQELSLFSRGSASATSRVDPNRVVRSVCRLFSGQMRYRHLLRLNLREMPDVMADAGHLRQVLLNLLINAAHALPDDRDDGCILVESRQAAEKVEIDVTDNGAGIPPELLGKIFDPFFTTKPVGKGTGMGLAISRQLVARMGGDLSIRSEPGSGTTATVTVPVWHDRPRPEEGATKDATEVGLQPHEAAKGSRQS
jgi:two-component system NtrC family sensor kinase